MKETISVLAVIILFAACKKNSTPAPIPPLIDIDGNSYDTVKIGSQFWMKQNLTTSHYRNGDLIPEVTGDLPWVSLTTGAWCWYSNDPASFATTYGKLYNWFAVNDPRGLAPLGWHIPSDAEWTTLTTSLGGASVAGGTMKEAGLLHWVSPNFQATNSSRFTGLPGGMRRGDSLSNSIGSIGDWWSSTEYGTNAWSYYLYYSSAELYRDYNFKTPGISVRCVKD
jgi:uncharacterized protein (TIGR02145 family)